MYTLADSSYPDFLGSDDFKTANSVFNDIFEITSVLTFGNLLTILVKNGASEK